MKTEKSEPGGEPEKKVTVNYTRLKPGAVLISKKNGSKWEFVKKEDNDLHMWPLTEAGDRHPDAKQAIVIKDKLWLFDVAPKAKAAPAPAPTPSLELHVVPSGQKLEGYKNSLMALWEKAEYGRAKIAGLINDREAGIEPSGLIQTVATKGLFEATTEELKELLDKQFRYTLALSDAIKRVEAGTYGICKVTGEAIEEERLLDIPHAMISKKALDAGNVSGQDDFFPAVMLDVPEPSAPAQSASANQSSNEINPNHLPAVIAKEEDMEKFHKRTLRMKFSQDELNEKAEMLAAATHERDELIEEKKQMAKDQQNKIDGVESHIKTLSSQIREKYSNRVIDTVYLFRDFDKGERVWYARDKKTELLREPLTADDHMLKMNFPEEVDEEVTA